MHWDKFSGASQPSEGGGGCLELSRDTLILLWGGGGGMGRMVLLFILGGGGGRGIFLSGNLYHVVCHIYNHFCLY
jgi:hypothetical protein